MIEDAVKVERLECPECRQMLAAETGDVAFYCAACRKGFALEEGEMRPVRAASLKGNAAEARPFWALACDVQVHAREASQTALGFFGALFGGGGAGRTEGPVTFFCPAFEAPLDALRQMGLGLTRAAPPLQPARGGALVGAKYGPRDAERIARYLFLSLEAEQKDTVKSIRYDLAVREAVLCAVPFERAAGQWKEPITGTAFRA